MTQEEKQILLVELCARLPYGIICLLSANGTSITEELKIGGLDYFMLGSWEVKPYLRPMSSMTKEEKNEFGIIACEGNIDYPYGIFFRCQDWLNRLHFDYRGLIKKNLALEAPKGMYK